MNLDQIPAESRVFIDANIFVYAFSTERTYGPPCLAFLERLENGEIQGMITSSGLSEIAHRLMTMEACETFGWAYNGIARQLRRHPEKIATLTRYRHALDEIIALGVFILPVFVGDVNDAAEISQRLGLLSGDALIVAKMNSENVVNLASNDADFDRIPGFQRFSPS